MSLWSVARIQLSADAARPVWITSETMSQRLALQVLEASYFRQKDAPFYLFTKPDRFREFLVGNPWDSSMIAPLSHRSKRRRCAWGSQHPILRVNAVKAISSASHYF